jgi:methanogenic corrinoid protein MtbC1
MVSLDGAAPADCFSWPIELARDPVRPPENATAQDAEETLARLIEAEIIPRLMLAHSSGFAATIPVRPDFAVSDEAVDAFAQLMIRLDLDGASLVIEDMVGRGAPLEAVFLDLFARTARQLGEMWLNDSCSFADVTIGLCGLQKLLRAYGPLHEAGPTAGDQRSLALLAPVPGEQHIFGIMMLESFFRQAGWDVIGMPLATEQEMLASLSQRNFALAGFSISCEAQLQPLAALIKEARKSSRNKSIVMMAGGRVFNDDPSLIRAVGADITARDGRQAVVATQHVLWSTVGT